MGAVRPSMAQSAADRVSLAAWDDSLGRVTSGAELGPFAKLAGKNPSADGLRTDLYLLRRGELTHERGDIERVITRALVADQDHRDWRWVPFVLARAYAALEFGGWHDLLPDGGRAPEEPYADAAWRNLGEALRRDPEFASARRWMIALLVPGGDRLLNDDQQAMIAREVARPNPDADALLVWARHLRALRLYDSALATFDRSLALGGDPSRLSLERARTLRALHDTTGASAAYWNGIAQLTPTGRGMYRYDLAWIVGADSLAAFDRVPDSALAGWLHRFWDERDAAAANHPGERLDEHLRRWVVAYARYRVRSPWRRTMYDRIDMFFDNDDCLHLATDLYNALWHLPPVHPGDLRSHEWLLDHRGILYLRHGEPLQRFGGTQTHLAREDFSSGPDWTVSDQSAFWSSWAKGAKVRTFGGGYVDGQFKPGLVPYQVQPGHVESWLYLIDGQVQLLHFRDSEAIGEYDATTLSSFLPYNPYAPQQWFAISGTMPEYHDAAARIKDDMRYRRPDSMPKCWNEMRVADAKSRSDMGLAIHEDSDSPPLVVRWQSVIQMFALGDGHAESGKALLSFALGGPAVHSQPLDDGRLVYPIQYRLVAWERTTGQRITLDTARNFVRNAPLPAGDGLVSFIELPLPPGDWQIAVRATQGSDTAGAYALRRDLHIDAAPAIALSDIVLGLDGAPSWMATDGKPFPLNAMAAWPVASQGEMFFEVHGVAAGASYRTTIDLRPVDPKQKASVRISSTDQSAGPVTHVRKSLGLGQLPAGKYQLTVTVEAGGQRATRTQALTISAKN